MSFCSFERTAILDKYKRGKMTSLWDVIHRIYIPLSHTEQRLLKMSHFYTILNQIVFFALCDSAIGSRHYINSLYSLMLYHVLAYSLHHLAHSPPFIPLSNHPYPRHIALPATSILLHCTNALALLLTAASLLLALAANEGLHHHHPTLPYTLLTLLHYCATEKSFLDLFPQLLSRLHLEAFESLEAFWAPVILKAYTMAVSGVLAVVQVVLENYRLGMLGLYVNVFLCWREAEGRCLGALRRELAVVGQFRDATAKQISVLDDICSVCLSPMRRAKVTPCQHLFHAECLRRCLKRRSDCPICKREL